MSRAITMSRILHVTKPRCILSPSGVNSTATSTANKSVVLQAEHIKLLQPAIKLKKPRNFVPMREVSPSRREIYKNWRDVDSTGRFLNTPTKVKVTASAFEKQPLRDVIYHKWRLTDSFGLMPDSAGYMKGESSADKADSKGGEDQAMGVRGRFLVEKAAEKDGERVKDGEGVNGGQDMKDGEDVKNGNESQKGGVPEEMMKCAVGCPGCKMLAHKLQSGLQLQETLVSKIENVDKAKAAGLPSTDDEEEPDAVWGRGSYPHTRLF